MTSDSRTADRRSASRRAFLLGAGGAALALAGCAQRSARQPLLLQPARTPPGAGTAGNAYGAMPDEPFPIPAVDLSRLPPRFRRQTVAYDGAEKPGTVVVNTGTFYLYHVQPGGQATRYGVGLGREGFAWSGRANIRWKREWPTWTPPAEMIARQPELAEYSAENGGMAPGLDNPLGARALYIFQGGEDTLYRLHGTPEIGSIGKAVSSGCVRLVNQDIVHLYDNVRSGSPIVVL